MLAVFIRMGAGETMKAIQILMISLLFPLSVLAEAEPSKQMTDPTELISTTIGDARDYVKNNRGKVSDEKLRKRLEEIIFSAFDFREMARRSLGKNWKKSKR